MSHFDTICAPITAPGGAVSIIRLSGPDAWSIASSHFHNFPSDPRSHRAYYGRFSNGDDGLLVLFANGQSYTGEESAELNLHGSSASVSMLIAALEQSGCRLARPGEFTERAFLNGRLDLSQAEAVNDTVRAVTDRQLALANELRSGSLLQSVTDLTNQIFGVVAAIEATVDFSEEIGDLNSDQALSTLAVVAEQLSELLTAADQGRYVREGIRIAIVGPPNAGKSSLLNRLLGVERAIVTDIAGTTRDYVEETCILAGLQCVLIDTAGLRTDTSELVESIGIQRARAIAASADVIWYVFDSAVGLTHQDRAEIKQFGKPVTLVANKSDQTVAEDGIAISTYTGDGIRDLIGSLKDFAPDLSGVVPNRRHAGHLGSARDSIELAIEGLRHDHPSDLLVTHLKSAVHELGLITGETADQDLLARIFSDFCIGK